MKRNPLPVIDMDGRRRRAAHRRGRRGARASSAASRSPKFAVRAASGCRASRRRNSVRHQRPHFPIRRRCSPRFRSATSRDEILASLLLGIRSVARKAGLLVAKKDQLVGWMCNAEFGDTSAFRAVSISLATPSIFSTSVAGRTYLGPLYRDRVTAPLLDVMGSASRDIALTPVRVLGKTAVLVIADELGDTMLGTKAMEDLSKAAGEALARIVRRKHE